MPIKISPNEKSQNFLHWRQGELNGSPLKCGILEIVALTVLLSGAAIVGTTRVKTGIRSPLGVLRLMITLSKRLRRGLAEPKEARLMCSDLWGTTSNMCASFSLRKDCWDPSSNSMWASACILPFTTVAMAVFNKHAVFVFKINVMVWRSWEKQ